MTGFASSGLVLAGWIMVGLFAAAVIFFVIRGARQTKTIDDYAVGSFTFNPVFVGLSLAAAMTSTASFVIMPGIIGTFGVSGFIAASIVTPLACLGALIVLTKGFRKYGQAVKANTMAQWIATRYASRAYGLLFGVISLLLLTFIVLNCVALTKVLSKTLDLNELYVLIGVVVFIFGYMAFGGANSMVYTNAIQAGIMVVVAGILIGSGYEHFSGGVHGFLAKLSAISPSLGTPTNPQSFFFRDYFEIIFCGAVVGVAIVCQPHILTRSLLLKKEGQVNWFLGTVSVVMLLFFTVIISGLYARIAMPNFLTEGIKPDGLMAAWVVKEFPVYIALVVVLGLIAAGVSTLEGLIQAISTTITTDLLKPIFGRFYPRERTDRFEMKLNRVVIAVMGLVTLLVSWQQLTGAFSVIILVQNGVYTFVAAALVPVLFGTFIDNVPRIAPVVASITAIVVHWTIYLGGLTPYMKAPVKNPGVPAAIAIVSSVVVGTVVLLVARALQRQRQRQPRPRPASAHGAS